MESIAWLGRSPLGRIALVALGGAVGAVARHVIGLAVAARAGQHFPWHTFAVNVSGAFLLGVLAAATGPQRSAPELRLLLGTGLLGGYTTFSTLAYESLLLLDRDWRLAAANMVASGTAGILAAFAGMVAGRAL